MLSGAWVKSAKLHLCLSPHFGMHCWDVLSSICIRNKWCHRPAHSQFPLTAILHKLMECVRCGTWWISLESLVLGNWNYSSPNSDIPFFNNLGRHFLYQYHSHKQLFHWCFAKHGVSFRSPVEEKEFLLYMHLSLRAFYLLSKVTRLTLQESLKIVK